MVSRKFHQFFRTPYFSNFERHLLKIIKGKIIVTRTLLKMNISLFISNYFWKWCLLGFIKTFLSSSINSFPDFNEIIYQLLRIFNDFWHNYILQRKPFQGNLKSTEAVVQRYSVKKLFLEVSQNSQKNTCARVPFLIKLQGWDLQLY